MVEQFFVTDYEFLKKSVLRQDENEHILKTNATSGYRFSLAILEKGYGRYIIRESGCKEVIIWKIIKGVISCSAL